jgi:hypothetical protein
LLFNEIFWKDIINVRRVVLLGIAQVEKTRTKTSERKIVLNEMRINVEIRRGGGEAKQQDTEDIKKGTFDEWNRESKR